jgi:branched-chain amino acid transport system ATP-binding protein
VGLIGPNGAGKTTLFNCIMGVHSPTGGTITYAGKDIAGKKLHQTVRMGISRVPQHSNPVDTFTVEENIRMHTVPDRITVFNGGAPRDEIARIAAQMDLEDKLDLHPDSLPHAERRRLEIAKSLADDPDLLLLDEPFSGQNQSEIELLSEKLRDLRDSGITIVLIDHNMKGLMELVDRIVVLHNGAKLTEGVPEEIARDDAVREAYLGKTEVFE